MQKYLKYKKILAPFNSLLFFDFHLFPAANKFFKVTAAFGQAAQVAFFYNRQLKAAVSADQGIPCLQFIAGIGPQFHRLVTADELGAGTAPLTFIGFLTFVYDF